VAKATEKPKDANPTNSSYILPLFSPIPAKSAKEIIEISKYFKKQQPNIMEKNLMYRHSPNRLTLPMLLGRHLKSKRPFHAFKTRKLKPFRKS